MNTIKMPVDMDLSEVSFEEAVLILRKDLEEQEAPVVALLVSAENSFHAVRLIQKYEDDRRTQRFLQTKFLPPWIDLLIHHGFPKYQWMVIGKNNIVWSPGA